MYTHHKQICILYKVEHFTILPYTESRKQKQYCFPHFPLLHPLKLFVPVTKQQIEDLSSLSMLQELPFSKHRSFQVPFRQRDRTLQRTAQFK